ncbi:MAG TPA: DUF4097 domain-containing protein [Acholeplasmataceae bacterium]|nr:DUF4097 domain-containing protein [Acholeplasmataceae bacterium]
MFKKLIIAFACVGLILMISGFILIKGNLKSIVDAFASDEDYELITKTGSEKIDEVYLDLSDRNVTFYHSEDESYKVTFYESEKDKINFSIDNGKLTMKNVKRKFNFFNFNNKSNNVRTVDIYLPISFQGKMQLDLTSGKLNLDSFNIFSLEIDITSGNININNVEVESDVKIELTSGKANIDSLMTNNFDFDGTSGKVTIMNSEFKNKGNVEMTSGNIDIIDSSIPTIVARSTSGNIDFQNIVSNHIDIDITSGNADLTILGNVTDYKIEIDVTSGNVLYQGLKIKGQTINPNGIKSIKIELTTGNGTIEFVEVEK